MGTVDPGFALDLRNALNLSRAVETGTFQGVTARSLADIFMDVVTIELSPELQAAAAQGLSDLPNVRSVQGHSGVLLREVAHAVTPTLYFLDGHWSGGDTAGVEEECPVLDEIAAIGPGHPNDCLIVDDARLFTSSPPPPHRPEQWPSLLQVFDALRALHPTHLITVLGDQIIAVPQAAKAALDAHGLRVAG
jgi:hypothetical protein